MKRLIGVDNEMIELEVKVLNNDLNKLEEKLKDLGAKLIAKERQINTIIDTEEKYIQKELSGYLRIRETKSLIDDFEKMTLTFKKDLKGEKLRENLEINSDIKEKENILKIFKELGYDIINIGYKERISYKIDNIRFDLDIWDEKTYPFPYMEIEVKDKSDLDRAIKMLDLDRKDITKKSITELQNELK